MMTAGKQHRTGPALKARLRPLGRAARRLGRHATARIQAPVLALRNRYSSAPVTGNAAVTVSLTSYGARLDGVHLAIESIGRGTAKPRRLILWVEDPLLLADPPPALARLAGRGLELRLTQGYGPHTKYFPYAVSLDRHTDPLVTADDDILYPRRWLRVLLASYARNPGSVSCHWANRIVVRDGRISDYRSWQPSRTTRPRLDQLALGVSGVLYPPQMLQRLAVKGPAFQELSPTADDIWLHWVALRSHTPVRQVSTSPRHFPVIPGSQSTSLLASNVHLGRNNEWVQRLYTVEDVREVEGAYRQ